MNSDEIDVIRRNLDEAIKGMGLSRTKVGTLSGVSYQHLTRFLNNTRGGEIGISILMRLAKTLGLPASALLGETITDPNVQRWNLLLARIQELPTEEQDRLFNMYLSILDNFK